MSRETLGYVELEWTCPKCGSRNPGPQKTCGSCGAPQPDDVQFEQVQGKELVKDEVVEKQVKAGADIHCAFCGARNPASASVCSQCGADLKEGTHREKGRVVGAYKEGPVKKVACSNCGAENLETDLKCSVCGATLTRPEAPVQAAKPTAAPPPQKAASPGRPNWMVFGIVGLLVLLCICSVASFAFLSSPRESQNAIVQEASWRTSIAVEALQPVTYQTWQDEIPLDAQIGRCQDKVHHVQDQEPAGSKSNKVCGTPYVLDTGTGQGQVVQDCQYEVLLPYCDYTVKEWQQVDMVTQSGAGFSPTWPEPSLRAEQRLGEQSEEYIVVFETSDGQYTYRVNNFGDYQQFQLGSEWMLNLNAFDQIVSVEPAR